MSTYNLKANSGLAGYELGENSALGGAGGLFGKVGAWWRAHRAYRQTFMELDALSNRDLADIGVSRSDIPAIAAKAAHEA
jgi:uncharacterized protein YjiS (DUF1127 family)